MKVNAWLKLLPARLKAAGISHEQIAGSLGVTVAEIDGLVNFERCEPRFQVLLRVLQWFNLQIQGVEVRTPHGVLQVIDQFRAARSDKMTKELLTERAGTNRPNYFKLLKNPKCDPTLQTVTSLADAAGCPLKIVPRASVSEEAPTQEQGPKHHAATPPTNSRPSEPGVQTRSAGPTTAEGTSPPSQPVQPTGFTYGGRFTPRYVATDPWEDDFGLNSFDRPEHPAPRSAPARSPVTEVPPVSPAPPVPPPTPPTRTGWNERMAAAQPAPPPVSSFPPDHPADSPKRGITHEPPAPVTKPPGNNLPSASPPFEPPPWMYEPSNETTALARDSHTIRNAALFIGTAAVATAAGTAFIRSQPSKDREKAQVLTGVAGGLTAGSGFAGEGGSVTRNSVTGTGLGLALAALVDKVRTSLQKPGE